MLGRVSRRRGRTLFASGIAVFVALMVVGLSAAQSRSGDPLELPAFALPDDAVELSPDLFDLGVVEDEGRSVQGLAIVRYDQETADANQLRWPEGNPKDPKEGAFPCFVFTVEGARWDTIEPWLINPFNLDGLTTEFLLTNFTTDIDKWEDAASGAIGPKTGSVDILGDGEATDLPLLADAEVPDGINEVHFGDILLPGVIAVTIIWGNFSAPVAEREIVEWDQVYDGVDFFWSPSGEPDRIDLESVATHELGHATGLGHPDDRCTEETMFRQVALGETKKRDLHSGDIEGISALYAAGPAQNPPVDKGNQNPPKPPGDSPGDKTGTGTDVERVIVSDTIAGTETHSQPGAEGQGWTAITSTASTERRWARKQRADSWAHWLRHAASATSIGHRLSLSSLVAELRARRAG